MTSMDRTGEPNKHLVRCDWCYIPLVTGMGYRVQMATDDPLDFNWACASCYDGVWV